MKRLDNLYSNIYTINNLNLADKKARLGKTKQYGIKNHDINKESNIINLYHILKNCEYNTSEYTVYTLFDPKERQIFRLPYYPDRITHHGLMNILEPIFIKTFTKDTYSCIKGRGIHGAFYNLKKVLKDRINTKYCLKLDIKKFYPSINHYVLKKLLRRKFKDKKLLILLDNIIDSAIGLPIGNYLSQYLANFYLTYFDHWIKEVLKVRYYFRYCDDIIILASNKQDLHKYLSEIKEYLLINLKLEVKYNYQIFPVASRGIDFVGYVFYHTHILLRKGIKLRFIKMIKYNKNRRSIGSYNGWLSHCNSINLKDKYLYGNY